MCEDRESRLRREATATQHEAVRRSLLRSMLVRWRRRQLTCGFNALQAAMLLARTEVLILTFFQLAMTNIYLSIIPTNLVFWQCRQTLSSC